MEKTIRELCKRVAATNSFDTGNEAVIAYQDLIGHATEEENQAIANTPELIESFYKIYGVAYGTCAAIKFYLANSDKLADMQCDIEELKAKLDKTEKELKASQDDALAQFERAADAESKIKEMRRDMDGTLMTLRDREAEIVALKAKLYDLEHKEA